MDINRYIYISAVAALQNLTKAAEELHISQPALTKAIRRTEEETGVQLFERRSNSLRLTYAGERFLNGAKNLIEAKNMLDREMLQIASGQRGKMSLGIHPEIAASWLPKMLPEFAVRYPDIEIEIIEATSEHFAAKILDGTMDFCIYTLPVYSDELDYEILGETPILLVSSETHPFAKDIAIAENSPNRPFLLDPQRMNGERFLTITKGRGMQYVGKQIFEKHGIKVNVVLRLESSNAVSQLAASGFGMCFATFKTCEELKMKADLNPVFYTLDNPVYTRKTMIAYKKGCRLSLPARTMIEMVKRAGRQRPQRIINVDRGEKSAT